MVGVNIGDIFTPTPWDSEAVDNALSEARSSGYFSCDAVKFWHCDQSKIVPTASRDYVRKVVVHANNEEMLTVTDWKEWIEENLLPIVKPLRRCRVFKEIYLAVGNEVLAPWNVQRYGGAIVRALRAVSAALEDLDLADRVKIITPLEMSTFSNTYPPSASIVSESHHHVVTKIVRFLVRRGSPFCVNVYPFFARNDASEDFILFGPEPGYLDGPHRYNNMFNAQYDAVLHAIAKLEVPGGDGMEVVVTECGWPTAHNNLADPARARRFIAGVVNAAIHGTPMRPGRVDIYLFELYDESRKEGEAHEQHFGLFDIEGTPKRV